jgi:hypothetical protein
MIVSWIRQQYRLLNNGQFERAGMDVGSGN